MVDPNNVLCKDGVLAVATYLEKGEEISYPKPEFYPYTMIELSANDQRILKDLNNSFLRKKAGIGGNFKIESLPQYMLN